MTRKQRIRELEEQLAAVHTQQNRQLLAASLVALIVMALVSLVLGRVLARRVLRPLRRITSATRRISADSLDRRLAVAGPTDEVKELADTIDELLERLEASFAAQRRFVANASHELRTPLATMRASLDVAVAKPDPAASTVALADRLRTQLDRVDHLLDGFLVLARAQHGAFADAAAVDLDDLVREALRDRHADTATKGLRATVDVPEETVVQGSPALLARLVGNVVDNAVTHNENGGWIEITGSVTGDGGGAGGRDRRAPPRPAGGRPAGAAVRATRQRTHRLLRARSVHCGRRRRRTRRPARPARPARGRPARVDHASGCEGPGAGVRILVVEDDRALAEVVAEGLRDQGMAVDLAHDGLAAAAKLDLPVTTWWSWTGICPASTATRCAR